eukprot:CAMPEP_0119101258 /NCGR_PEP_ID=MMETSP1180-20130426/357_1 /TAXON_ID=3052 ORGANISM="Chlamydomonas cf sp, Strain CCMP681" /NCGR_SAMPLE_ID=MMETSP1180 /ASSEMBLY_ACC=CAM_ASM_000741 /LENGTH=244 /DNA_ID=CAMNT_0007085353 /DNA_START=67 /DNA_END=802 /DNA_ORIENTATION=+
MAEEAVMAQVAPAIVAEDGAMPQVDLPAEADQQVQEEAAKPEPREPVKLGHVTFTSGEAATSVFKKLLATWPKHVDCNEYEHLMLLDLLKKHPDYERKLGVGIRSFQVRSFHMQPTPGSSEGVEDVAPRAFFAVRKDGSTEDFSYIKCLVQLFPDCKKLTQASNDRALKKADLAITPATKAGEVAVGVLGAGELGAGGLGAEAVEAVEAVDGAAISLSVLSSPFWCCHTWKQRLGQDGAGRQEV